MDTPFGNIPSLQELLNHPAAKPWVERANPQAVVSHVRDFLSQVRASAEAMASTIRPPQPGEWIDRFTEWMQFNHPITRRAVINATGAIVGDRFGPPPLADEALRAQAGSGSCYFEESFGETHTPILAESLAAKLTGAEAAWCVSRPGLARLLILTSLANGRSVVMARRDVTATHGDLSWSDAIEAASARKIEVGSITGATVAEMSATAKESPAVVLRCETPTVAVVGTAPTMTSKEFTDVAHSLHATAVADIGWGGLWDLARFGLEKQPTPQEFLSAGFDLVVMDAGGWLGGPACGIVVGRRALIDAIRSQPAAISARPSAATLAALESTLRHYEQPEKAEHHIPVLSLVSTSAENLRQRAERLSVQLAGISESVRIGTAPTTSLTTGHDLPGVRLASYALVLTPVKPDTVEELHKQLREDGLIGRVESGAVVLDLRSVLPAQDVRLAAVVLENLSPPLPSEPPPKPTA
jgi:L-seryl-tRNA(Ser) seleniumtransferase